MITFWMVYFCVVAALSLFVAVWVWNAAYRYECQHRLEGSDQSRCGWQRRELALLRGASTTASFVALAAWLTLVWATIGLPVMIGCLSR